MKATSPIIHFSSDEAAKRETFEGWRASNGQVFIGTDASTERVARYAGCTHRPCEDCEAPTEKMYTRCPVCRAAKDRERHAALPPVEYVGQPCALFNGYDYFFEEWKIVEYLDECAMHPRDAMLVDCTPEPFPEIDETHFADALGEDGEVPDAIANAMNVINKVIRAEPPIAFWPGKRRVVLPDNFAGIDWDARFVSDDASAA